MTYLIAPTMDNEYVATWRDTKRGQCSKLIFVMEKRKATLGTGWILSRSQESQQIIPNAESLWKLDNESFIVPFMQNLRLRCARNNDSYDTIA